MYFSYNAALPALPATFSQISVYTTTYDSTTNSFIKDTTNIKALIES